MFAIIVCENTMNFLPRGATDKRERERVRRGLEEGR